MGKATKREYRFASYSLILMSDIRRPAHTLHQSACEDQAVEILRHPGDGVAFPLMQDTIIDDDRHRIPLAHMIRKRRTLDEQHPVIDRIAEENAGERLRDDAADSGRRDDLRRLLPR